MRWTPLLATLALAIAACTAPPATPEPSTTPSTTTTATPVATLTAPRARPPFAPDGRTTDPRLNAVIERLLHDDARTFEQHTPTLTASEPDQHGNAPTRTVSAHDWATRFATGPRSLYAVAPAHPQAAPLHDADVVIAVGTGDAREAWRFAVARDEVVDVTILRQFAGAVGGTYETYLVLPPQADLPKPPPGYPLAAALPRTGDIEVDRLLDALAQRDTNALAAAVAYEGGTIPGERCVNDAIQPVDRREVESQLSDLTTRATTLRSVIIVPAGATPRAEHLIVVSVEKRWYEWADAALLETGGKIVGIAEPNCVIYPPKTFLVVPRDARPPIDPEPRSGNPIVDAALNAFEARDRYAILASFDYASVGCIAASQGIGSPPLCRPGESVNTPIKVLPGSNCEGYYARADEMNVDFLTAPTLEWQLYAVMELGSSSAENAFFRGGFAAIIAPAKPDQTHGAIGLIFSDRGITSIWYGCGPEPPLRQLARFGQTSAHDYLLAPPPKR